MDRKYKPADRVSVYPTINLPKQDQERSETLSAVPYSRSGHDYYARKDKVHPGFQDRETGEIYIFLDYHL